jgi:hypothetical protein
VTATSTLGHDLDALPEHLGIYVYGIVGDHGQAGLAGLTGLDDSPVELVDAGEVAAVVGVIALDRPPGRKKELLAHTQVLDTLAAHGAVAPVQFGTVLAAAADVRAELLEGRGEELVELLESLEGRQQFTVRGRYNEHAVLSEIVAENPEIAALRERTRDVPESVAHGERVRLGELVAHAMERKREQDSAVVLDIVLPHVDSYAPRSGAALEHMMEVALLVEESRRAAFEDALEAVAEAMHERVRLQLLGPMAPYDFVGH